MGFAVLLAAYRRGWARQRAQHDHKDAKLAERLIGLLALDYVLSWDVRRDRGYASLKLAKQFGFPGQEFGNALEVLCGLVQIAERDRFRERLVGYAKRAEGKYIDEAAMVDRKGGVHYILLRGQMEQRLNDRPLFIAVGEDVTALRRKQWGSRTQSGLDELTRLPNRKAFENKLAVELIRNAHCGVLLVGLDSFKNINNVYGYDVGDALLKNVAMRLRAVVGERGDIYRFAGDIYAIILNAGDYREGEQIEAAVSEAFKRAWRVKGYEIYATATQGLACAPKDGHTPQDLMHSAEIMFFHAKQFGKNCHVMYSAMQNTADKRRMAVENAMRRAIENDFEGFSVHYQPVIDLQRGDVAGAEALLRFSPEELDAVTPSEFIPLAEYLGLIVPIGRWVLEKACEQCSQWHKHGHEALYVSVNISIMQMLGSDFVTLVRRTLRRARLDPRFLVLEITENMFIQDMDTVVPALIKLREMGVRISLDDFGKGYSSLTHLRDIPLDEVKIDRDFVQGLGVQAYYETFIHTIVTLAHTINLRVTSEGIETQEQRVKLAELGSDNGQGFYVSPAIQPDRLLAML